MGINNRLKIAKMVLGGYISSLYPQKVAESINTDAIDFVVTWVDGTDSEWNKLRKMYLHENEIVKNIEKNNDNFLVTTHKDEYCGKTIILATGSSHKHLEIPGEEEYLGKGVSYCATCEGLFFKDKDAIMIGGGNSALQEAIFLDNVGCNVTIIHRRDELRAQQYLQKEIKERNIDVATSKSVPITKITLHKSILI